MPTEGLLTIRSAYSAPETLLRLREALASAGQTVFAHIDHSAAAELVGMELPKADLLIFGDARAGTPLMRHAPTLAIDLPMKALVWEDAAGLVWLSLNDFVWLAARHGPPDTDLVVLRAIRLRQLKLIVDVTGTPSSSAD